MKQGQTAVEIVEQDRRMPSKQAIMPLRSKPWNGTVDNVNWDRRDLLHSQLIYLPYVDTAGRQTVGRYSWLLLPIAAVGMLHRTTNHTNPKYTSLL